MIVKSIRVNNYRNLEYQTVNLQKGLNVFCGLNAQGKTNFLECLVLSSLGKSPRTDRDKDLINWDKDWATVRTEFSSASTDGVIEIKLSKTEKKRVAVNGLPIVKIGELLGWINVIYFSPEEIKVIREGPDARRRFMDIDLCQTDKNYLYTLGRYNRILSQRNNLLKSDGKNKDIGEMLSIWDRQLAKEGAKLYLKRRDFVEKISPIAAQVHQKLTDGREEMTVVYQTETEGDNAAQAESWLTQKLADTLEKQVRLGFTTNGVHRDDIKFTVNGVDIRKFGSQGQQRTAALALKIAEAKLIRQLTGEYPILLLDDVFSEIDACRSKQLLSYTAEIQTVLTATEFDETLADGVSFTKYQVKNGRIYK